MMKKIVQKLEEPTVNIEKVDSGNPIFAQKDGRFVGMIVNETNNCNVCEKGGWIVRIGGVLGVSGHFDTLKECMLSAGEYGYEFYTNVGE